MAKVRSASGKMACVFLVLLVATSLVGQTSAQAPQLDWMGLATGLLQNTFLGPFVTAINAVSGGVPNLSGALLGLTNNVSQAATQLASNNGFNSAPASSAGGAPAVFRRNVNVSAAPSMEHQTPKSAEHPELDDPTHDLYMELEMPQHQARAAAFQVPVSNVSSASGGAFFGSPAYFVARNASTAEPQHPVSSRNAAQAFNSTGGLHARGLMNASSAASASDSSLHPKAAVNVTSNHVRAEDDDDDSEATVANAEDDADDSAQYVNVHARMVFKRAAVYNASAPGSAPAQHTQQARAEGDGTPAAGVANNPFLSAAQNANTLLANGALGATNLGAAALQATGNLAAGTIAATNNLFAQQANALGALGVQQAATLNNAAIGQTAAKGSQLGSLEAQKVAALEADKGGKVPQKGNKIDFPPAPQTTPKPAVYYTPSPKFYAKKPVYQVRPAAGC